jgi:hypothetical protein
MSKAIEITGTDTIVLTHEGVVVGHIKIKQNNFNSIEFVGQAVNLRTPDYSTIHFTHLLAAVLSMQTM